MHKEGELSMVRQRPGEVNEVWGKVVRNLGRVWGQENCYSKAVLCISATQANFKLPKKFG